MAKNKNQSDTDDSTEYKNDSNPQTFFQQYGMYILLLVVGVLLGLNLKNTKLSNTTQLTPSPSIQPVVILPSPPFEEFSDDSENTPPSVIPSPQISTLNSSVCPVSFVVPSGRIYISNKQAYAAWQLKDFADERFTYLPRSEEVNGRRSSVELRIENQLYGNAEALVNVQCQDNPNKWGQSDFLSYVLKTDFLKDPYLTQEALWGRQVGKLSFIYPNGSLMTLWLFATPSTLIHVSYSSYNPLFFDAAYNVFTDIKFLL